jgi:hypothetical protein
MIRLPNACRVVHGGPFSEIRSAFEMEQTMSQGVAILDREEFAFAAHGSWWP